MQDPLIPGTAFDDIAGPYTLRGYVFQVVMELGPWVESVRRFFRHLESNTEHPPHVVSYEIRRAHDQDESVVEPEGSDILLFAPGGRGMQPSRISLGGRAGYMRLSDHFFGTGMNYLGTILEFLRDHVAAQALNGQPLPPLFHAAAFASSTRTLWMPGLSEAGKTTQTLALLLSQPEVKVLADDIVFIDPEQRTLEPYLLPLRLSPETVTLLAQHEILIPDSWCIQQFCCPPPEQVWSRPSRAPSVLVALGRSSAATSVRSLGETEALRLLLPRGDILRFPYGIRVLEEMIAACEQRLELLVGNILEGTAVLSALLNGATITDLPARSPDAFEIHD